MKNERTPGPGACSPQAGTFGPGLEVRAAAAPPGEDKVPSSPRDLHLGEELGKGGFATVRLGGDVQAVTAATVKKRGHSNGKNGDGGKTFGAVTAVTFLKRPLW